YCTRHFRTFVSGNVCALSFRFASDNAARMFVNNEVVFEDHFAGDADWCTTSSCCSLCCDTRENCEYVIAQQEPFTIDMNGLQKFHGGVNEIRWEVRQDGGGSGFLTNMIISR
ncbi:MAG: hypothetical protein FJ104_16135, partial [Deltaproteobacteria bacterium]|nr:hypothetical protein [Deltaproteobacteria bacterium]